MSFTSHIPRSGIFKPSEGSRLSSQRNRNSPSQSWKQQRDLTNRVNKSVGTVSQARQQLRRIQKQQPGLSGMHPFKIYQFPRHLRLHQNDDDWRRVKVRYGFVNYESPQHTSGFHYALGSDFVGENFTDYDNCADDTFGIAFGEQVLPTDNSQISPGLFGQGPFGWNEITVPDDGDLYDIWFSFFSSTGPEQFALLFASYGSSWTDAIDMSTGDTVATPNYFGETDNYNIKVGTVTVQDGRLRIKQELFGNVFNWPNPLSNQRMRFRGAYNGSAYYFTGDVVTYEETTQSDGGLGGPNHYGFLYQFVYSPVLSGSYDPQILKAAMTGVAPITNTPDPWVMLSRSPIGFTSGHKADWIQGAYDASSKWYLRVGA